MRGTPAGSRAPAKLGEPRPKRLTRRTPSRRSHGTVDYTLAKRALLRDLRTGMLSRLEVCDAHPDLLRAARHLGMEATRPCPVCGERQLRLLAYVFADTLKTDNGRPWAAGTKRRGFFRRFWWVFLAVPAALFVILLGVFFYLYSQTQIPNAPPLAQTTYVYDRHGKILTTLHAEVNRTEIPVSQMPLS